MGSALSIASQEIEYNSCLYSRQRYGSVGRHQTTGIEILAASLPLELLAN